MYTLIGMICVFLSVLVHELGHALVTKRFGWQPHIVLYFFGGFATTTRHSPWKNITVTAAGPLAGLAFYFVVKYGITYALEQGYQPNEYVAVAVGFLLFANLLWSLMNLIPVFPLDGGQIVRELLTMNSPRNGEKWSMLSSMVAAAIVVALAAMAIRNHTGLLGLEPRFMAIMFAILGVQNFQMYDSMYRRRW